MNSTHNPPGWTDRGMRPGWLRPVRMPQDSKVKRLQEENQTLQRQIDAVMSRLVKLEESADVS